ncbi:hypothetical protein FB107DRAFT_279631 [Schizophyllum commune]
MALRLHAGISFCVPHVLPIKSSCSGCSRTSPWGRWKLFSSFEEPDVTVIRVLLDNCLPHTAEFGFFLSTSRFELDGFV